MIQELYTGVSHVYGRIRQEPPYPDRSGNSQGTWSAFAFWALLQTETRQPLEKRL